LICAGTGARRFSLASLANAIWGFRHDPRECRFVAMTGMAYYDASGAQDERSGVLAFMGVVATEDAWAAAESCWEQVLGRFKVPYFHAKEYAHSTGAFEGWKGEERKRKEFLQRLIHVMGAHVDRVVGVGVVLDPFHRINAKYQLAEKFGDDHPKAGAYAVAGWHCIDRTVGWIRKAHPGTAFGHVVEKGDAGQDALRAALTSTSVASAVTYQAKVEPATGQRVRPFEVADLAGYECRHWFQGAFTGDGEIIEMPPRRRSHIALREAVDLDLWILDDANLHGLVQDHRIEKRRQVRNAHRGGKK